MALWNKIAALKSTSHHIVDWEALRLATKKAPNTQHIWAAIMAPQKLPTGNIMSKRGVCTSEKCPRGCGHLSEDITHVLQCSNGDTTREILQKVLQKWGERNISAPQLLSAILHGITEGRKCQLLAPPPSLPLTLSNEFENRKNIV